MAKVSFFGWLIVCAETMRHQTLLSNVIGQAVMWKEGCHLIMIEQEIITVYIFLLLDFGCCFHSMLMRPETYLPFLQDNLSFFTPDFIDRYLHCFCLAESRGILAARHLCGMLLPEKCPTLCLLKWLIFVLLAWTCPNCLVKVGEVVN